MRLIHAAVFMMLTIAVSAGTVTLSGTCPSGISNGTAGFSLSNSGNESATSLLITLHFIGTPVSNQSVQLNSIGPSQTVNATLPVYSNGSNGTFGAYFLVAYRQDTSVFSATFPCLINIGNGTASQVLVDSKVVRHGNSSDVNVQVINGGYGTVNTSVDLILPLGLIPQNGTHRYIVLNSTSRANVTFPITYASGTASYTGAVVASYSTSGVGHAAMSTVTVGTNAGGKGLQIQLGSVVVYALAAVVLLLVLLIARSLLRRRKH